MLYHTVTVEGVLSLDLLHSQMPQMERGFCLRTRFLDRLQEYNVVGTTLELSITSRLCDKQSSIACELLGWHNAIGCELWSMLIMSNMRLRRT
jgi:hypothetical protein